jgi:hypothetical protein
MQILCRGYLNEKAASVATLAQIMDSIRTFEIERPELEIVDVRPGEEEFYVNGLFVEGSGDFAGWLVSKKRSQLSKYEVFCESGSVNAAIEVLHCGAPELIKKQAVLTTERVLSLFSRLISGLDVTDYEIMSLFDVTEGL